MSKSNHDLSDISVTQQEYKQLLGALDMALAQFGGKPTDEGFELEVYNELRKVRETVIRAHRDLRDKNIPRDSRSPLEST